MTLPSIIRKTAKIKWHLASVENGSLWTLASDFVLVELRVKVPPPIESCGLWTIDNDFAPVEQKVKVPPPIENCGEGQLANDCPSGAAS